MKRMKQEEIKAKAESLAFNVICCHGVKNARDVLYEAYKRVREESRREIEQSDAALAANEEEK